MSNSTCPGCGGGVHGSARLELTVDIRYDEGGYSEPPEGEIRLCVPCVEALVFKLDDLKAAIKEICNG